MVFATSAPDPLSLVGNSFIKVCGRTCTSHDEFVMGSAGLSWEVVASATRRRATSSHPRATAACATATRTY